MLYKGNDEDFPDEDDMVTIHVKMTMVAQKEGEKNEVLENSRKRRRPFRFKVSGGAVIPGKIFFTKQTHAVIRAISCQFDSSALWLEVQAALCLHSFCV